MGETTRTLILGCLLVAVGALHLATIRVGHDWGPDFAIYIRHAQNIASGQDYQDTKHLIERYGSIVPWTYPPLFPLLLAPIVASTGVDLVAMKVEIVLVLLLSLIVLYFAFRRDLPFGYRLLLVAAVGLNPYFLYFKNKVVSDLPFLLFAYLALALMQAGHRGVDAGRKPDLIAFAAGLATYLAYATRSVGAMLAVCLVLYELYRWRKLTRFGLILLAVFLPLALVQNVWLHNDLYYVAPLVRRFLIPSTWAGHFSYFEAWGKGFAVSTYMLPLVLAAAAVCLPLILLGYVERMRKRPAVFEFFPPLYLVLLLIWPGGMSSPRFLIPLVPLAALYMLIGLKRVLDRFAPRREGAALAGIAAAGVVAVFAVWSLLERGPIGEVDGLPATRLFAYLSRETNPDDTILFFKGPVLAVWSERRSSTCALRPTYAEARTCLENVNPTHLVIGEWWPENYRSWRSFISRNPDRFRRVYSTDEFEVYEIET